ncbi:MAG: polymer-forming cytoskeletal protein [Thalassolituus sp.]|jgi:cytoskeletal protein CcmA (bactofilin family)|uniref:Integral membrane protein CcmA involved in cell shape determination n=1 Tax=hydrothermal vent metagenome TaxID=652676 RepID=A0A170PLS8_9ZZZZ|nr:polymer-forming cytoskeletal protein [Thalassolituus oleivorans]AHK14808.1 cell shape-determining protein CcmA [Thalassolituus oleivorans R6-15]MBQ0728151.1 polymer-forming cytoskeletal protein [Thalassolituus oleivorans]MBQ0781801.1 polymer-forming cytoskeletal protein [Thalassolituus oleivorans]MDF1641951.1 polymer-forming cytoskeletal protein [Thalassolituus oleivorans]|tara:strand:- start:110 stop:538 length:429 start_codon:yes stop_codon:yes gene_type:complete
MFSSKDKSDVRYDTLISAKTEIHGDVILTGGLHIDGLVKGNLIAEAGSGATVRVSEKGRVEGQITAPNIIINGEVIGDVHASEYIELAKKARVKGDVYYQAMEMVLGAQVNGQLHHSQDKASTSAKSQSAHKTAPDNDAKVD